MEIISLIFVVKEGSVFSFFVEADVVLKCVVAGARSWRKPWDGIRRKVLTDG
jgi:hypothetical protein